MKKTLAFIAVSGAVALLIAGCSKKNDAAYTVKQLAGTYKLTASTATVPGLGEINAMDAMEDCQKDDLQILHEDSTYEYVDAGVQCQDNNGGEGRFVVKGNLLISDPDSNEPDTATIKSFNGTTLVLGSTVDYGGVNISGTLTLTKQ